MRRGPVSWDLWCSLECTPACQAGGRGFKSRQVRGRIAQLVERAPEKCEVAGSTPAPTTSSKLRAPSRFGPSPSSSDVEVELVQAATDLCSPETTVAAKGADGRYLACASPTSDRLWVDPEERCNFRRGKKRVSLLLFDHFGYLLGDPNLPQTYESGHIGAMA